MAGIGFELRRLVRADGISANLRGIASATVVSSGPWLITCLALAVVQMLGQRHADVEQMRRFSILIIYNFSFSLVISGPIVVVVTRCLADALYAKDVREVSGLFLGALGLLFVVTAVVGVPLYGFLIDLTTTERLVALAGIFLMGGVWLVSAFLSALRSYAVINATFGIGMVGAVASAAALSPYLGSLGLLVGFTLGVVLIFFALVARILAEFPSPGPPSLRFMVAFRTYWELALVGLLYNAAIWVDKWVMWFAPGAVSPGQGLFVHPTYESAMFLAYLSVVPSMALFLVAVETRFYTTYRRFYRDIVDNATLDEIRVNHREVTRELVDALRRTASLQAVVCVLCIVGAPMLISAVGAGAEVVPIFRYGLIGAMFHVLVMLTQAALAYFDLRRALLAVTVVFFLLNAGLTFVSVRLGVEYHGYGYALATLLTFAVAFVVTALRVARLPYLTFIANNSALHALRVKRTRGSDDASDRRASVQAQRA